MKDKMDQAGARHQEVHPRRPLLPYPIRHQQLGAAAGQSSHKKGTNNYVIG